MIELDAGCVSWSINPSECYVLTKLKDYWTCECGYDTSVVDGSGRLQVECVMGCGRGCVHLRKTKRRNAGVKKLEEEE